MYLSKLKAYRLQQNLTLLQLAEKTGFSVGYLCHLERGTRCNPSLNAMECIATVLGKSAGEIFFGEEGEDGKEV